MLAPRRKQAKAVLSEYLAQEHMVHFVALTLSKIYDNPEKSPQLVV
jgi:hypothetical protein